MSSRAVLFVALAGLSAVGCAQRIHLAYQGEGARPVALRVADQPGLYDYRHEPVQPLEPPRPAFKTDDYQVLKLRFASAGDNGQEDNQLTARYYRSVLPGTKGLVIVVPIFGSYTYPSNTLVADFVTHGGARRTNLLLLEYRDFLVTWDGLESAPNEQAFLRELERTLEHMRAAVIDIRRLVDWAQAQPEIDAQRIGIVGFSMSALVTALVLDYEPRFAAGVLVMGGGRPHRIFAECEGAPERVRRHAMEQFGWSADWLVGRLKYALQPVDPVPQAWRVNPSRVLMVDAARDTCIPRDAQNALWQAMGEPERLSFLYDHKQAFLAMTPLGGNVLTRAVREFLEQKL